MMLELLIVDGCAERRADLVDALCELPGVEVRASVAHVGEAIHLIDHGDFDAVIGASDLPGASIVQVIDHARRRRITDIIVLITQRPLLPGMTDYWHDLGARHVVDTLPELVSRTSALVAERRRETDRHRTLVRQLEMTMTLDGSTSSRTYVMSRAGAVIASGAQRPRAAQLASPAEVLHGAARRWSRVVPAEVQVSIDIGDDVPRVRCTGRDLELIALHLVLDASEALPLGGNVWLCAERSGPSQVRMQVLESSGRPRVAGAGIDMIRKVAQRYGGDAHVIDLGGATSIEVTLPAVVDAPS